MKLSPLDIDRSEPAWILLLCVFGRVWFYNPTSLQDIGVQTSDLVEDGAAQ